jgi:metal-responsive CopG/Arc/MetJ family transcriptional regulator
MVREEYRRNYTAVSLPKELMNQVDDFIKKHPEFGFKSRSEFLKEAIRLRLELLRHDSH